MDIFLSYSWSCEALASRIESMVSEEPAFHILRDIHSVNTAERIHTFMDSIRTVSCAIVILNGNYLYSENCLYELMTFSKERDFISRIIPIEITGTKFFSRDIQREVTEYWKIQYQYNGSLLFEPNELRHTLEIISDLKCIVCDLSNENSINACVRSVLHAIFQHVFRSELRTVPIASHQFRLPRFPVLCIDFGTSYTLAAVTGKDGHVYMVRDSRGEVLCPSIIELYKDGRYAVGNAVTTKMSNHNTYIIRELKRTLLGADSCIYGTHQFSTKLLVAMLLHSVKRNAEEFFGTSFNDVFLSVPVDFRWREVHLMKVAAELAGLKIQRAIQESSTAAMLVASYAEKSKDDNSLNIDLGGGTIDISAANYGDGVCEILFSMGDQKLGSVDYDYAIADYIGVQLEQKYGISPIYPDSALYANILIRAEQIKIDLGTSEQTIFSLEIPDQTGDVIAYTEVITRSLYSDITCALTERLKSILERARKLAEESISDYPNVEIYLTGQGSKLFLVRELIQDTFPDIPLFDQYQESAVCQGLAKMAGVLTGDIRNLLLLDNLHFHIDILCDRYDKDEDIVYISADNHIFHRLINPEKGRYNMPCISIPYQAVFRIAFTGLAREKPFEIKLYDYSPSSNLHTLIASRTMPVQPVSTDVYFLIIDIDASSILAMDIVTEEEYTRRKALRKSVTEP